MRSITLRWSVFGTLPAVLAGTAVVAVIGISGVEGHPTTPSAVSVAAGGIRLADSEDDQLNDQMNQMEQQLSQQTAQQTDDISRQEQQIVDAQNAFDESMTAGNN